MSLFQFVSELMEVPVASIDACVLSSLVSTADKPDRSSDVSCSSILWIESIPPSKLSILSDVVQ